eukprot:TRINITY_DN5736_c0_g3_i1.p1 TRINITY_DN5736_c0_g3~~TRINITY_DN5736_c0_g3_i1.p1  ORF type:complete len:483 (-),score=47.39 TRINITY_DN5736_c0_g3_i1:147-1595(-)
MADIITIDSLPAFGTCDSLPPIEGAKPRTQRRGSKECRWLFRSTLTQSSTSGFNEDAEDTESDCSSLSLEPKEEDNNPKTAFEVKQPEGARPVGRRPMTGVCAPSAPTRPGSASKLTARQPPEGSRPSRQSLPAQPSFQIKIQDTSTVVAAPAKPSSPSKQDADVMTAKANVTTASSDSVPDSKVVLSEDTTGRTRSDAAESRPTSALSRASHANVEHTAHEDDHKYKKAKSLPASSSGACTTDQPPGRNRSDFAPSRSTLAKSSTTAISADATADVDVKKRGSLLVPGASEHSAAQGLTPTRPTTLRRGTAPTMSFMGERSGSFCCPDGMGGRDGSRSPCRSGSRSPCASERSPRNRERSPSPCPVYSQTSDAKGSGKDYNVVQFKATATVSNSRDAPKLSAARPRRSLEVVEPEPKQSDEELAKEGILKMFDGCSKTEVKKALRGTYSSDEVSEVLSLLGLNEPKQREKRRTSKSKRESA